jgi:hypothetical protein
MTADTEDPFDLKKLALPPEMARQQWAAVPRRIQKRRQHFVKVPWTWIERLAKTRSANTYRVAHALLYLHWKGGGGPIKLANGTLAMDGVTRSSKGRALSELERLGLILIKRHLRKSPTITVVL